jgi:putative membrane protein
MMNGGYGLIWMIPLLVIFWGGLIALIVWGIRAARKQDEASMVISGKRGPLDMAKERYAKGEISKEEFEQLKKDLS